MSALITRISRSTLAMKPVVNSVRYQSVWAGVPAGPPDPILGVTEAFKHDKDPVSYTHLTLPTSDLV